MIFFCVVESNGILKITGIDVSSQGYQESWLVEIPEGLVLFFNVLLVGVVFVFFFSMFPFCCNQERKTLYYLCPLLRLQCMSCQHIVPKILKNARIFTKVFLWYPNIFPIFLRGFPNPQSNFASRCLPKDNEEKTDNWYLIFLRQQMREVYRCQREQVEMDFILGIKAFDLDKMLGWEGMLHSKLLRYRQLTVTWGGGFKWKGPWHGTFWEAVFTAGWAKVLDVLSFLSFPHWILSQTC